MKIWQYGKNLKKSLAKNLALFFSHEKSFVNRLKSYFSSRNLTKFTLENNIATNVLWPNQCSESTCPLCKSWKPLRHVMCQVQAIVLVLFPIQKLWSPYYILAQVPHKHSTRQNGLKPSKFHNTLCLPSLLAIQNPPKSLNFRIFNF